MSSGSTSGDARVLKRLFGLAWPAVSVSFLQTGVFLADRLLLGRHSQEALASMQVQGPLLWSLQSVLGSLLVGTVPLVARAVGAGDPARAARAGHAALRIAAFLGAGIAVVVFLFLDPIVAALGPSAPELRALSARYIGVALLGFPQLFVATTAAMIWNAAGHTRTPFVVGVLTNGLNIGLNLGLIFGFDLGPLGHVPALGVTGSALGSVIAFSLEALLLTWLLSRPESPIRIGRLLRSGGSEERDERRALFRLSGPALVERIAIHAGYLLYSGVITRLGALVMAANQALVTLESICFLSADGFGVAAATLVGQSLGRKDVSGARRAGLVAALSCAALLSLLGAGLWLFGRPLLALFVPRAGDGAELVNAGREALPLLWLSQPFMAASVVLAQSLRGAGDTTSPVFAGVVGGALVRVALVTWLGLGEGLGIQAVWWASAVDWVVRTLWLARVFRRGLWTSRAV